MNTPDRADYYSMQLALMLQALPALVWGQTPPNFNLDKFKIKLEPKKPEKKKEPYVRKSKYDPPGPLTKEQLDKFRKKQSQGMWGKTVKAAKRLVGR